MAEEITAAERSAEKTISDAEKKAQLILSGAREKAIHCICRLVCHLRHQNPQAGDQDHTGCHASKILGTLSALLLFSPYFQCSVTNQFHPFLFCPL